MKRTISIVFILFSVFLSACINLKSPYPQIEYYRLSQEPLVIKDTVIISGSLQVRNFTAREDLNNDEIIAVLDSARLHRYYYHRWAADCPDLVTDFVSQRLEKYNAFTGGVLKTATIAVPEYILEGGIEEMVAYSSPNSNSKDNYVIISLKILLIKRDREKYKKTVLLNKTYTSQFARTDNEVPSIAPAFGKAFSQLTDNLMLDIREAVAIYKSDTGVKEKGD